MMLFSLQEKAKNLPTLTKLWMYPVAYILSGLANAIVAVVDKFNVATFRRMLKQ